MLIGLVSIPIINWVHQGKITQAISLGSVGFLILLPIVVAAGLISILAPLFIVIFDQKTEEAVNKSQALINRHWAPLSVLAFGSFVLQLSALFLAISMVKLAPGMTLISGAIVYVILGSWIAAYTQTAWVLVFLELIKPQKMETEQPVELPEIAS